MPPLEKFPKADIVTFKYYQGLLAFLEKNYAQVNHHPHRLPNPISPLY